MNGLSLNRSSSLQQTPHATLHACHVLILHSVPDAEKTVYKQAPDVKYALACTELGR